jgi:hypothetical protein
MFLFRSLRKNAMAIASITEFRTAGGHFAKGVSGNPAGRPKGSRNRATVFAEALVEERAAPLTAKMIEVAEGGDTGLLQLFFKAIIPPARDAAVELDVPAGKELDLDEVFRVTARALFDGAITPDQALRIGRFLSLALRVKEQKSKEAYREAKLRLEAERREAAPAKRQYFSREKAAATPAPGKTEAAPAPATLPRSGGYFSSRRSVAAPSAPQRPAPDAGLYFSREDRRQPLSRLYSSTAPGALMPGLAA